MYSRYQTPSKDTGILFPLLESWNPMTQVATIAADVSKRRVLCRISLQVLKRRFGASEDAPMECVALHRSVIQEAARCLIETECFEEDGSVVIDGESFHSP